MYFYRHQEKYPMNWWREWKRQFINFIPYSLTVVLEKVIAITWSMFSFVEQLLIVGKWLCKRHRPLKTMVPISLSIVTQNIYAFHFHQPPDKKKMWVPSSTSLRFCFPQLWDPPNTGSISPNTQKFVDFPSPSELSSPNFNEACRFHFCWLHNPQNLWVLFPFANTQQ